MICNKCGKELPNNSNSPLFIEFMDNIYYRHIFLIFTIKYISLV
ncbi:hypothetical protein [Clostridium estertheticum]|nr:hypothetical protein [Clostridium estertheticum]